MVGPGVFPSTPHESEIAANVRKNTEIVGGNDYDEIAMRFNAMHFNDEFDGFI